MKKPWSAFTGARSQSFVRDMVEDAREVAPADLMEMPLYRQKERLMVCGGYDPLAALVAYAQDELAYDEKGEIVVADAAEYKHMPREQRFNKFGPAYRRGAKFYLNRILADIVSQAAVHLYQTQAWTTALYDGLRTMEGHYNLYMFAPDSDISTGLLALPGQSAHNKGLAVDSMMYDAGGREVDMGGHFDHLDMETNNRAYAGEAITKEAKKNRLIREAAFLRSAFSQNLLIAPLRSEFWDDRPPENREDLWRVLDSAARCVGIDLLSAEDLALRKKDRAAFKEKWESWSYNDFLTQWEKLFKGREREIEELVGQPPREEKIEFYHGNFHPIYDSGLMESGKNLTI